MQRLVSEQDVILAGQGVLETARPFTVARKQIDDKNQTVRRTISEHFNRCICRQTAVAEKAAADLDGRKLRQKAAAGQKVID